MTDFPSADDLSKLSTAQLIVLHEVIAVESLITAWHVELGQLILAELEQRVAEQAIVNAKGRRDRGRGDAPGARDGGDVRRREIMGGLTG